MDLREVATFLRSRRERMKPTEAGLVATSRRRTPGLRRDEVAERAGISTEYYTHLEQARGRHPSRRVLTSIARALNLPRHERAELFELAGVAPGYPQRPVETPAPGVVHLLEHLPDAAVIVQDAKHDVIAWNPLATALLTDFAALAPVRRNFARQYFLPLPEEPWSYGLSESETFGPYLIAKLRRTVARYPKDPGTRRLLADLMQSPKFRGMWGRNDTYTPTRHMVKTTHHPGVGRLELDCVSLYVPEDDQEVVVFTAQPGSDSAARLRALCTR